MLVLTYTLLDGATLTEEGLTEDQAQERIRTAFAWDNGSPRRVQEAQDAYGGRVYFPMSSIVKIVLKTDRRVL
jgi:hypothetical protein